MTDALYFDDLPPGFTMQVGPLHVDRSDMLTFASQWDPLPIHTDDTAAGPGGITAPGAYMFALKMGLIHMMDPKFAVIASVGFDEVRFLAPVRAEDDLTLHIEVTEARESKSKPDRGLVTLRYSLINQDAKIGMNHLDTILVRKQP
jgi:acyl dehydratase